MRSIYSQSCKTTCTVKISGTSLIYCRLKYKTPLDSSDIKSFSHGKLQARFYRRSFTSTRTHTWSDFQATAGTSVLKKKYLGWHKNQERLIMKILCFGETKQGLKSSSFYDASAIILFFKGLVLLKSHPCARAQPYDQRY